MISTRRRSRTASPSIRCPRRRAGARSCPATPLTAPARRRSNATCSPPRRCCRPRCCGPAPSTDRTAAPPRELYFVKRNLDGRGRRVLAYGGESRFHPAGVHNIAELVRLAAARPGTRVLNAVDPDAPTVAEIAAAVDAVMGAGNETVLVDGPPPVPGVGDTPWSVPHPVVCDMTATERELGYRPVTRYADRLPETVAWIERRLAGGDWREAYPRMAASYGDLFDYAAEDAWLAGRRV